MINDQFPVMMSMIQSFSLYLFKLLMRDSTYGVISITIIFTCCDKNVTS